MKIGIITMHNVINYGSALQAYALRQVVEDLGNSAYIIDYRNSRLEELYRPHVLNKSILNSFVRLHLRSSTKELFNNYNSKYRKLNKKFKEFWSKYKKVTRPIYDIESLSKHRFDAIICGSDQIWESGITGGLDRAYFCDIHDDSIIKIAYAASGTLPDKENSCLFKQYVSNFNHVSVREKDLADYIKKIGIGKVSLVSDPALLLEKEHWMQYITEKQKIKGEYIFVYLIWNTPEILKTIEGIEKETGLNALIIYRTSEFVYFNDDKIDTSTPFAFLNLIYHSKYAIVNSYHGTVFSILFKKLFLSFNSGQRVQTVLDILGMRERLIEFDGTSYCKINDIINWECVEKNLELFRNDSIDFLRKSLNQDINSGNGG